ncbi:MAG: restriction endonuclease [Thiobacillus sp.]
MARRKQTLVDELIERTSRLPWWAGVVFALAAYFWLHSMATNDMTVLVQPGEMGGFISQNLLNTLASVGQYLLPVVFLVGAAVSAYGCYKRRALNKRVATSPDRGPLNDMSWHQFEVLVGEAFRRKGYSVVKTRGAVANGGFDLVLKKAGQIFLVHCKQWRALKVGVNTVRELDGLMETQGATGGFVVTSGIFTDEAQAFAAGRNIELMDGKALHALMRGVNASGRMMRNPVSVVTTGAPFCPECQGRMVLRKAKRGKHAGKAFWSCLRYPECPGRRRL